MFEKIIDTGKHPKNLEVVPATLLGVSFFLQLKLGPSINASSGAKKKTQSSGSSGAPWGEVDFFVFVLAVPFIFKQAQLKKQEKGA